MATSASYIDVEMHWSELSVKSYEGKSMRLLKTFFFLIGASTTAFACPSGIEPSIGWMLNASALVFRGQVVRESTVSDAQGVKEHVSDVAEKPKAEITPTEGHGFS